MKIAFISHVLPADHAATQIIFHRHFGALKDTEFVFYSSTQDSSSLPGEVIRFDYPTWLRRISNTRFHQFVESWIDRTNYPPSCIKKISNDLVSKKVDLIVTLAQGREAWMALACAERTKIPLVSFFHDDFWRELKNLESFFEHLARKSQIAFCVSPRMLQRFKPTPAGARLLWPIPDELSASGLMPPPHGGKFRVLHTGTLYPHFEEPLLGLMEVLKNFPELAFYSTGQPQGWSKEGEKKFLASETALGFLSREELNLEYQKANVLLSFSPFAPRFQSWVRSYFPSKVIEYSQKQRPILIWAPGNSALSDWVETSQAAIGVHSEDPYIVVKALQNLKEHPGLYAQLIDRLSTISSTDFSPKHLQHQFETSLREALLR